MVLELVLILMHGVNYKCRTVDGRLVIVSFRNHFTISVVCLHERPLINEGGAQR